MQTVVDIEENQLNQLLFYTHTETGAEAITTIIQDYLQQKQQTAQKKQLLQNIQKRFASIPKGISLADELIAERRIDALKDLK